MELYYYILFYTIGAVSSYYTIRFYIRKGNVFWEWPDIFLCVLCSLLSWLSFVIMGVVWLLVYLEENYKPPEPPKWL